MTLSEKEEKRIAIREQLIKLAKEFIEYGLDSSKYTPLNKVIRTMKLTNGQKKLAVQFRKLGLTHSTFALPPRPQSASVRQKPALPPRPQTASVSIIPNSSEIIGSVPQLLIPYVKNRIKYRKLIIESMK